MTAQIIPVSNSVPVMELDEVVIGSQLRLAVLFERLISETPDVFEALDFTGMTLEAHIKDKPSKEISPDAEFVCTPRLGVGEEGWVDFYLSGTVTGTLLQKTYYASFKIWPTATPEQGDTLLTFVIPMVFKATR